MPRKEKRLFGLGSTAEADPDTVLMKNEHGWGSDKASRRRNVAEDYRILLPNPIYGSWEGAIYDFQYRLCHDEKLKRA